MLLNILFIIVGFVLLIKGGDYLVDGSVAIAQRAKLSPMVIGLTVIGFGTSAPELLVSTQAAIVGSPGIAIGNVVGSNIANIALIIGLTAIIVPLGISKETLFRDLPFMLFSTILLVAVGMTGTIERWQGIIGVLMLVAFVGWQVRESRKQLKDAEPETPRFSALVSTLIVVASIAALALGANVLIEGASGLAMQLGEMMGADPKEMERIIGLTIVAVGTSFPELFASVQAARKGQIDMAVGNVVGSVTFNVLSVIGFASAVCPIKDSDVGFLFDYAAMVILGLIFWLFLYTNRRLDRWEGLLFVCLYVAYIARTLMI